MRISDWSSDVCSSDLLAVRLKASSGEGFSCNPAKIDGGSPNNVVPDHAILRVNFRPRRPQDEIAAKAVLDECISRTGRDHGVVMHLHGGFGRPPKAMGAKADRKSVGEGRRVAVSVDCGGSRILKKKKNRNEFIISAR